MQGPWNLLSRGPPNQIKRSPQPIDSYLCTVFCLMSLVGSSITSNTTRSGEGRPQRGSCGCCPCSRCCCGGGLGLQAILPPGKPHFPPPPAPATPILADRAVIPARRHRDQSVASDGSGQERDNIFFFTMHLKNYTDPAAVCRTLSVEFSEAGGDRVRGGSWSASCWGSGGQQVVGPSLGMGPLHHISGGVQGGEGESEK
jgi:hypothetical protein